MESDRKIRIKIYNQFDMYKFVLFFKTKLNLSRIGMKEE